MSVYVHIYVWILLYVRICPRKFFCITKCLSLRLYYTKVYLILTKTNPVELRLGR
jgi:hypothetical protein